MVRNRSPSQPKLLASIAVPRLRRRTFCTLLPRDCVIGGVNDSSPFSLRVYCTQDSLWLDWNSAPCPLAGWCFDGVVIASSDSGMRSHTRHASTPPQFNLWPFWIAGRNAAALNYVRKVGKTLNRHQGNVIYLFFWLLCIALCSFGYYYYYYC